MTARIIATILVNRAGAMVKGKRFMSDRVVGVPVQAARVYASVRELDEICLLFVDVTADGVGPDLGIVAAVAKECFVPLTIGGGIHSVDTAAQLIACGADKVVLGTAAFQNPPIITDIAARFGSQAVVVSVDARSSIQTEAKVILHSGKLPTFISAHAFAAEVVNRGAGEILLQSVDQDGTLSGYDVGLLKQVRPHVDVPIILSGGCSGASDMAVALREGADAVAAGALWSFRDATPNQVKRELAKAGFAVRLQEAA